MVDDLEGSSAGADDSTGSLFDDFMLRDDDNAEAGTSKLSRHELISCCLFCIIHAFLMAQHYKNKC